MPEEENETSAVGVGLSGVVSIDVADNEVSTEVLDILPKAEEEVKVEKAV